jgi:hypothetical protein
MFFHTFSASFIRKIIAVSACLLTGPLLFAQKGFDFGLKLNVQSSSLINNTDVAAGPELDYKNPTNIAGGVSAGYTFTKHLGAEINILYSKQGQGYKGDASQISPTTSGVLILSEEFQGLATASGIPFSGQYTSRIDLTYIKIPILLRFTGKTTKKVFFSSFIGPQIDMLSSAKIKVNDKDAPFTPFGKKNEDAYKKVTVDAVLGVGLGINLPSNLVLSFHLRLDYGLGDAENKSVTIPALGSTDKLYDGGRASTHNATVGGLISLNYKLVKKAKGKDAGKPAPKGKK